MVIISSRHGQDLPTTSISRTQQWYLRLLRRSLQYTKRRHSSHIRNNPDPMINTRSMPQRTTTSLVQHLSTIYHNTNIMARHSCLMPDQSRRLTQNPTDGPLLTLPPRNSIIVLCRLRLFLERISSTPLLWVHSVDHQTGSISGTQAVVQRSPRRLEASLDRQQQVRPQQRQQ